MVEVSVPQIKHLSLVVACQKQHTLGPGIKQVKVKKLKLKKLKIFI